MNKYAKIVAWMLAFVMLFSTAGIGIRAEDAEAEQPAVEKQAPETTQAPVETLTPAPTEEATPAPTEEPQKQEPEQKQESSPASPEPETAEPEPVPQQKDSPVLYTKICKGCGKEFQTIHRQSMYCSSACYPSNKEKQQSQTTESPEKASAVQRPI